MSSGDELKGKKIALLATGGFEQSELEELKKHLEAAGAKTEVGFVEKRAHQGVGRA